MGLRGRILIVAGTVALLATGGTLAAINSGSGQPGMQKTTRVPDSSASTQASPSVVGSVAPSPQKNSPIPSPSPKLPSPGLLRRGNLALDLSIRPPCGRSGATMTATLKAVPGAWVSLIVSYADGQSYGTWYAGPTAPDGSLIYPWVIPPNAAEGRGHVFAAGHDPATQTSGTVAAVFHVAGSKGC